MRSTSDILHTLVAIALTAPILVFMPSSSWTSQGISNRRNDSHTFRHPH